MRIIVIAIVLISSTAFADVTYPIVCRDNNPNIRASNNIKVYKLDDKIIRKLYVMPEVPVYGWLDFVDMKTDGDSLIYTKVESDGSTSSLAVNTKTQSATWDGGFIIVGLRGANEEEKKQGSSPELVTVDIAKNFRMKCTFGVEPTDLNRRWPDPL
jgi:hypothetical protein